MKLAFSIPSGYHLRELVLPLRRHLETNDAVAEVHCITPAFAPPVGGATAGKPAQPLIKEVFSEFGPKFFYHENPSDDAGHKELLLHIAPDRVVTNTVGHDELDEPIMRIAKELRIPTITFIASWDNVWKIERLIQHNKPIAFADRFVVWNEMMKEHLLRIRPEIQEQNIAVIGAPRLDYFTQTDRIPTKETIYQKLGFSDTSRPFIHLATTELYPTEYLAKTIARAVATQDIPGNPYLYASIHPGGDVSKYDSFTRYGFIVRRSPGRHEEIPVSSFKYAPTEEDTFFLAGIFMHAGALVNHSSTTALESLVANVPVINVQYGMPFDWWRWHRSMVFRDFQQHYRDLISDGATYVATSKKTLIASLRDVLLHPDAKREARKKTVKRMITTTDGTASKKVLEYILAL